MSETETVSHGHDEAPSYDDINTPVILLVGVISALITLLTIMFVQGLCYFWQNSETLIRAKEVENMPAVVQIDKQKSQLSSSPVPINDAMKKIVSTYGK